MKIAPPDEGANHVVLEKINAQSRDITQVGQLSTSPPLTPVERKREEQPRGDRERRQVRRRQARQDTLLDTRATHDRRTEDRREDRPHTSSKGIDVEA